jgi:hypothetical protein
VSRTLGEAVRFFERLLTLRNDVGLLSEQYDVVGRSATGAVALSVGKIEADLSSEVIDPT